MGWKSSSLASERHDKPHLPTNDPASKPECSLSKAVLCADAVFVLTLCARRSCTLWTTLPVQLQFASWLQSGTRRLQRSAAPLSPRCRSRGRSVSSLGFVGDLHAFPS